MHACMHANAAGSLHEWMDMDSLINAKSRIEPSSHPSNPRRNFAREDDVLRSSSLFFSPFGELRYCKFSNFLKGGVINLTVGWLGSMFNIVESYDSLISKMGYTRLIKVVEGGVGTCGNISETIQTAMIWRWPKMQPPYALWPSSHWKYSFLLAWFRTVHRGVHYFFKGLFILHISFTLVLHDWIGWKY